MNQEERCRIILKDGSQCRNKGRKRGLCGTHLRGIEEKKSKLKMLLTLGQYAAASTAVIKLIETIYPLFLSAEAHIAHMFAIHDSSFSHFPKYESPHFGTNDRLCADALMKDAKEHSPDKDIENFKSLATATIWAVDLKLRYLEEVQAGRSLDPWEFAQLA